MTRGAGRASCLRACAACSRRPELRAGVAREVDRLGRALLCLGRRPRRLVLVDRRSLVELVGGELATDHEARDHRERDAVDGRLLGEAGAVLLADDGPPLVQAHRVDVALLVAGEALL